MNDATSAATRGRGRLWTPEEDEILIRAIASDTRTKDGVPFQNWSELATSEFLHLGRTGKMVRDRWTNYLDPKIDRTPFSRDDDIELFHAHGRYGKRWAVISERAFGSRRSENHVKNRVSRRPSVVFFIVDFCR